jgi:CRP/FNR family transcriptional regulator, cyclic AMP receptor protein
VQYADKLKLIKAIPLLGALPERQLTALAQLLKPKEVAAGAAVFEEGSVGMSLYFISSGDMRIVKKGAGGQFTDIAILNPGDFFGESALIEESFRSAGAVAVGPVLLFELFKGDLQRWTKLHPQQAVAFFAELLNEQSRRLRRTTNELALYVELSDLSLDPKIGASDFLNRVLATVAAHLEGKWAGAAYLAEDGKSKAVAVKELSLKPAEEAVLAADGQTPAWIDSSTLHCSIRRGGKTLGSLVLRASKAPASGQRDDIARTVYGASEVAARALELIGKRA